MRKKIKNQESGIRSIINSNYLLLTSYFLRPNSGFSFIELLVVVTLIGVIGYLTTSIFILGFRAQAKSEILKEVKQNGDYVLSVMESTLKSANDVDADCNGSTCYVSATDTQNITTKFSCISVSDERPGDYYILKEQTGFPDPTPAVRQRLISDRVVVQSCKFVITNPKSSLDPKYVVLSFNMVQANPNISQENKAYLRFQSTVSLRNYQ
jgi:prepilin-type N-terminal cleavage/methylation domain-containing protein